MQHVNHMFSPLMLRNSHECLSCKGSFFVSEPVAMREFFLNNQQKLRFFVFTGGEGIGINVFSMDVWVRFVETHVIYYWCIALLI